MISWRLRFFHWLTQGQITTKEEQKMSSNLYNAQSPYGTLQTVQLSSNNNMNLPGITFKITNANGGTIVSVKEDSQGYTLGAISTTDELYIIPDGVEDFDRELGKIITMHRMKQK
jgi:urocanate hydratase